MHAGGDQVSERNKPSTQSDKADTAKGSAPQVSTHTPDGQRAQKKRQDSRGAHAPQLMRGRKIGTIARKSIPVPAGLTEFPRSQGIPLQCEMAEDPRLLAHA